MAASDYFGSVGTSATSAGIGLITNAINGAINSAFARGMADYNHKLNEDAANKADARRRALYLDYESPAATIRQLKEAGLSPSIYAQGALGGGIGSTAGAQGQGASGISIPGNMGDSPNMAAHMVAQAQARLLNAEADKLEGKNFAASLDAVKVFADAGLAKASTRLKNAESTIAEIQSKYVDETQKFSLQKLKYETEEALYEADKAFWDAESAGLEWRFNNETFETRKEELANTIAELAARTAMEKSNAELSAEQKAHIKDFAKAALDNAKAHADTAEHYGDYVQNMGQYFKDQIELRGKELNLEKWRIGVDAISNVLQTGTSLIGSGMFGNVTKTIVKGLSQ